VSLYGDSRFQLLYDKVTSVKPSLRHLLAEILKSMHAFLLAFVLMATAVCCSSTLFESVLMIPSPPQEMSLVKDFPNVGHASDPRWIHHLVDGQLHICFMSRYCERSLLPIRIKHAAITRSFPLPFLPFSCRSLVSIACSYGRNILTGCYKRRSSDPSVCNDGLEAKQAHDCLSLTVLHVRLSSDLLD
jgi:hypothetical protein